MRRTAPGVDRLELLDSWKSGHTGFSAHNRVTVSADDHDANRDGHEGGGHRNVENEQRQTLDSADICPADRRHCQKGDRHGKGADRAIAGLAFDHHHSETVRLEDLPLNYITDPAAPSAARVVYNYYGGADRFPDISPDMMAAVDKGDSADFTMDEVLHPEGWVLLNFLMDARTGLGRFREFRISNYQLMMKLIDYCRNHNVDEILSLPDVVERVDGIRLEVLSVNRAGDPTPTPIE